jgi:putative methanogenesis marker protein 3
MNIRVDGEERTTEAQTVGEVLGFKPTPDVPVLVMRTTTKEVEVHNTNDIETTKGTITIETRPGPVHDAFKERLPQLVDLPLQWDDKYAATFGTVPLPFEPTRKSYDYDRYEVLMGLMGHDRQQGILAFQRQGHIWNNGIEKAGFGTVIKGRSVLARLGRGDAIRSVSARTENAELYDFTIATSPDVPVHDGDMVLSKLIVDLDDESPYAVEHFLFLTKDGHLPVSEVHTTFATCSALRGVELPPERIRPRTRGSLSVRTSGKEKGTVYVYLKDVVEDKTHTVFGETISGIELVQEAQPGHHVRVEPRYVRLNTLGYTVADARALAQRAGISFVVEGTAEDDAVVVSQHPELSTAVMAEGSITVEAVDPTRVFTVRLYDVLAPQPAAYFKTISGLKTRSLGRLTVFFAHEEMDMVLFSGNDKLAGTLTPENHPEGGVRAGEIGITNMASRQRGTIGIRFGDSEEYGPTGEDFIHTNIVGKLDNIEGLRALKEGDTVYLLLEP